MNEAGNAAKPPSQGERHTPRGAYETSLGMAGLSFLSLIAFVLCYGVYGDRVTAGLDTACARAAFEAGRKLEALGNHEAALQRYRQAMEGRFADQEVFLMCGRAVGDLLHRQQRYAEAIAAYQSLPEEAFARSGGYTGYVNALLRDGQMDDAEPLALVWLAKAQKEVSREQTLWAHMALMEIMEATERPTEALRHAEAMIAIDANSTVRLRIARMLERTGRHREALDHVGYFLEHTTNLRLRREALELKDFLLVQMNGS